MTTIFQDYRSAVDAHNSLNSQLSDLKEELEIAKAIHIKPIMDQYAELEKQLNAAREKFSKAQDELHEFIMSDKVTAGQTLQ
jgi:predicted  nucleic acid-binding Zn-ribbon protein